jgi:hypothetical protein
VRLHPKQRPSLPKRLFPAHLTYSAGEPENGFGQSTKPLGYIASSLVGLCLARRRTAGPSAPLRSVEEHAFFITLGGPQAHDLFGRDDKSGGCASM